MEPVVATRFDESFPALSADGRWVAYTSDQSGVTDVYVRPLVGDGDEVKVSLAGGTEPVWSRAGGELFYRSPSKDRVELTAATLRFSPEVSVTGRRRLFDVSAIIGAGPHANYDVSPDGRTFAMVRQNPASRIIVLQNAPALFRQLERVARR